MTKSALQKIESHEKLCRIMQKLTHDKIHDKLDQRFDNITNWIIYGLGAVALLVITQLLYILSK